MRALILIVMLCGAASAWAEAKTPAKKADAKKADAKKADGAKKEPAKMAEAKEPSPVLQVSSLGWLAGTWRGEERGAFVEESWAAPQGDNMLGSFRAVEAGKAKFYELIALEQDEEGVVMRIRHFGPKLVPWEAKDALEFRLSQVSPTEAVFANLGSDAVKKMIYKVSGKDLTVELHRAEGEPDIFRFKK